MKKSWSAWRALFRFKGCYQDLRILMTLSDMEVCSCLTVPLHSGHSFRLCWTAASRDPRYDHSEDKAREYSVQTLARKLCRLGRWWRDYKPRFMDRFLGSRYKDLVYKEKFFFCNSVKPVYLRLCGSCCMLYCELATADVAVCGVHYSH